MGRLLIVMSIAMAALEVINAPFIEFWPAALVFAGMFLGFAAWFFRRGTLPPVILLAILFLVEVVFIPGYGRESTLDWVFQIGTVVFSVIGLVAAVGTILGIRRTAAATA